MSVFLASVQRFLLVRGLRVVDCTDCWWCTDAAICSACSAKADEARALLAIFDGLRSAVSS